MTAAFNCNPYATTHVGYLSDAFVGASSQIIRIVKSTNHKTIFRTLVIALGTHGHYYASMAR